MREVLSDLRGVVQFDKTDHRGRVVENHSLLRRDSAQRGIDVGKMVQRNVPDKDPHDLIIAHASVKPAQEEQELNKDRPEARKTANREG
jgi:hypothetical protein